MEREELDRYKTWRSKRDKGLNHGEETAIKWYKTWTRKCGKCAKHRYGRVIKCVKHGERREVNV